MADHRLERLRDQAEKLEQLRGVSHEVTLLRLYALDAIDHEGDLDTVAVHLDGALAGRALYRPERLSWCSKVEVDRFGVFAKVEVETIRFRMRYLPPGTFLMGSPEGEEGHCYWEGPQHEVRLSKGFWMSEVPCTQARGGAWDSYAADVRAASREQTAPDDRRFGMGFRFSRDQ